MSLEQDLIGLLEAVGRDAGAFDELAARYGNLTESAARRFAPSFAGEDSTVGYEDLLQNARMALYRAALTYRPDGEGRQVSFGLYAKICINNALISLLRKARSGKRKRTKRAERELMMAGVRSPEPMAALVRAEDAAELRIRCRQVLSPFESKVFDEYVSGKSTREIAEIVGREERSVSNALYRMKVKIRGLLKP